MSERRTASYLNPIEMWRLDMACKPIVEAFDETPYLVGSVTERRDFRDVDVRLMLDDDRYDCMRDALGSHAMVLLGFAMSALLSGASGLPVDFQFQRRAEANELHPIEEGRYRNPLGVRHLGNWTGDASPDTKR